MRELDFPFEDIQDVVESKDELMLPTYKLELLENIRRGVFYVLISDLDRKESSHSILFPFLKEMLHDKDSNLRRCVVAYLRTFGTKVLRDKNIYVVKEGISAGGR